MMLRCAILGVSFKANVSFKAKKEYSLRHGWEVGGVATLSAVPLLPLSPPLML